MFGIGTTELLVFGIIAVLLFFPRKAERGTHHELSYREFHRGFRSSFEKPRFTLKDLLASISLIALGLAWIVVALPKVQRSLDHLELPVWMFVAGGAILGAGALAPFKRAHIGAIVGTLVQLALVQSAYSFGWPRF